GRQGGQHQRLVALRQPEGDAVPRHRQGGRRSARRHRARHRHRQRDGSSPDDPGEGQPRGRLPQAHDDTGSLTVRNTMAIAKREFQSYVTSPIPYILVTAYIATAGYMFFKQLFLPNGQADMRHFFESMPLLFCLIIPFVTMRLVAEERREGTLELLLTMPVTHWQLVTRKFLAALRPIGVLPFLTLAFPLPPASLRPLPNGAPPPRHLRAPPLLAP